MARINRQASLSSKDTISMTNRHNPSRANQAQKTRQSSFMVYGFSDTFYHITVFNSIFTLNN